MALSPCSFLPAPVTLCFAEKSCDSGSLPYFFCYPPPCLPPNSNFLHPRSQFYSRLLSLSLLSDLSPLFRPKLFIAKMAIYRHIGHRSVIKNLLAAEPEFHENK